ncbi:MAG TPA: hypothetical protein VFZ80_02515, partial [Acidimicrobiia bacterium]
DVTDVNRSDFIENRRNLGNALFAIGITGLIAALVVGAAGWILATRSNSRLADTIKPLGDLVVNVSDSVEATQVIVARTIEAVEGIESATRSAGRTLDSVSGLIDSTSEVLGDDLANGLDDAVSTLPALVDTGRIIDRTMRTLSLVGVDYDPEVPLDESLGSLEESLRPIPDQLRDQVSALGEVGTDIDVVARDAGSLAATLLEARIEMAEARDILVETGENVTRAAASLTSIEGDLETYDLLSKIVVVGVALALLTGAVAPLLIGAHLRRTPDSGESETLL